MAVALLFTLGACSFYNTLTLQEAMATAFSAASETSLNETDSRLSSEDDVIEKSSFDAEAYAETSDGIRDSASSDTSTLVKNNDSSNIDDESFVPDALKPVTFQGCCPDDDENPFKRTCLTEQACNDGSLYPFTSRQEATMFTKYVPTRDAKLKLRERCTQANSQMRPPTKWCSPDNNTTSSSFPMGCSHFSMAGGSGPYDRLLLFPQGKLAFCGIPKAGITQWLQFLRFTLGALDYQSMPYFKQDSKYFHFDTLRPHVQEEIWNGRDHWTKAILIREPAERLLSAYLDKVAPKPKRRNNKRNQRRRNRSNNKRRNRNNNNGQRRRLTTPFGENVTFAQFVDILAMKKVTQFSEVFRGKTGISWRTDPHWRPQAWSCGLSENVKQFDYIGTLDNAAFHTKALLQKVNMWDSFGKHYRVSEKGTTRGSASATWPPSINETSVIGFQQQGTNDNDKHNQDSRKKLDQYYTPELMKKVREIYWMDFQLWDAVKEAEREAKVKGVDIAPKLSSECKK